MPRQLTVCVEFAKGLKDMDFLKEQDPCAISKCGINEVKTTTIYGGGKDTVWNETFVMDICITNTLKI
jgi:hypothetical protein